MLRVITLFCFALVATQNAEAKSKGKDWWRNTVIYQIYPRSFKDSDGDGIGDLNGITSKLEHLVDIGVGALWLSSIYPSSTIDMNYDVSNFKDIDPVFGTMADFERLVARARIFDLKVILDFVPNHSSREHEWFKMSVKRIKPYDEYYVWKDAKMVNGSQQPPNNWLSISQGSAWEWNEERGQYYLHQFGASQPDLNYRSLELDLEMKDVLTFWLEKGVDGFYVNAVGHLVEDALFLDEPPSNVLEALVDDYDYLDHVYTKDLNETYLVLKSWRKLLDGFAKKNKTDSKILLTESHASVSLATKYYKYGSNVLVNYMFITDLKNVSTAVDFKRAVENWLASVPKGYPSNWVTGNHENHRVASRFGITRVDQILMLTTVLPGIAVVYNGDEIGMIDASSSQSDIVDSTASNVGSDDGYRSESRDFVRTPFQWDATINAGFSTSNVTWNSVNENYETLNLAEQKASAVSHYRVFRVLVALRKLPILQKGSLEILLVTDQVLGIVRRLVGSSPVVLVINFSDSPVVVNAMVMLDLPQELTVYTASVHSSLVIGSLVDTTKLNLSGGASVVLTSRETFVISSSCFLPDL